MSKQKNRRPLRSQPTKPVIIASAPRIKRIGAWVKRHWNKIAIGGVAAAGLTYGASRYYHYRTTPWVEVALMAHGDEYDGQVVVKRLRELMNRENVSVIALENMNSTEQENREAIANIEEVRRQFERWRVQTRPSEAVLVQGAYTAARATVRTPTFIPLCAEALIRRLPIRFIESLTSKQAEQARELEKEQDHVLARAMTAPTLGDMRKIIIQYNQLVDKETAARNAEMREELAKIRSEFRGNGTIFAATGEGHFAFPPERRTRVVDAFEPGKSFLAIRRNAVKVSPELRAARDVVSIYLETARVVAPDKHGLLLPAHELSKRLTLEQFAELDHLVGKTPPDKRINAVVNILIEWTRQK